MRSRWTTFLTALKGSYFKQFFSVFTAIFLVMTIIILQVLNTGIYSSVDKGLMSARDNVNQYVNFQMTMAASQLMADTLVILEEADDDEEYDDEDEAEGLQPRFKPKHPNNNVIANTDVVLYDAKGNVLNHVASYGQLYDLPLDDSALDTIVQKPIQTYWGKTELYRTLTVRVSNLNYPEVVYATLLINTDQLEASNTRSVKIIVSVMVGFWVISLFASLYLAHWTRKPILENYERQKNFVENASHELRTPLAVLQNRLEGLFRKPDQTILQESESIAASLDEVRNMKLLTANLLNLARREDGLKPEVVTIPPRFFDDVFVNYSLIAEENGKTFTGDNLLTQSVRSDKTLLKQLLTILFDNAIKYTGDDGQIKLTISQYDKHVMMTVADNGLGISDSDKTKIFDRFYRVDKARTRQKGGFGLGLALAKQIVTILGGSISVKDNTPKGSIFEVRLPL